MLVSIFLLLHAYVLYLLRMIPEVAVGIFCLKVVRYCMYMWLPMYLLKSVSVLLLQLEIQVIFFRANFLHIRLYLSYLKM